MHSLLINIILPLLWLYTIGDFRQDITMNAPLLLLGAGVCIYMYMYLGY